MAFDETLAGRIRRAFASRPGIAEKKMFGGLCFILRGNMVGGILRKDLIVRVAPDRYETLMKRAHTKPFAFTGKTMKGFVVVGPKGSAGTGLKRWLDEALRFVGPMKPKER